MKRLIDYYLRQWKQSSLRQPLLLRGARQVGKTYAVRQLGKTFEHFIEINFEGRPEAKEIFEKNLDPVVINEKIFSLTQQLVIPGKTLLFFDEVQAVPQAIIALRYFYEKMPELHVIAAGSLLDFAIQKVGVPVGRVQFMYMYPMSFMEFLVAAGRTMIAQKIMNQPLEDLADGITHHIVIEKLAEYLSIGGMPRIVDRWCTQRDVQEIPEMLKMLADAYRYDFAKYGAGYQLKYLERIFDRFPFQLGQKFKYSLIGDYRKRELEPCVDLLITAGVVHRVMYSSAQGVPLGAQAEPDVFKLIGIDVALSQFLLNLDQSSWLLNPLESFVNKGMLVEAFIGQEFLVYKNARSQEALFYWKNDTPGGEAEVDYVTACKGAVIPVEVKSGKGSTLHSMRTFLSKHAHSPYGVRFSLNTYSVHDSIHSYPLYSVARFIADSNEEEHKALADLIV